MESSQITTTRKDRKRRLADISGGYYSDTRPTKLRYTDTDNMIGFLEGLKSVRPRRQKAVKGFKMRKTRAFSLSQQAFVIYLRFGSLSTDKENWHSPSEVFKRVGIRHGAQYNIIQRWRRRGYCIENRMYLRGRKKVLDPE